MFFLVHFDEFLHGGPTAPPTKHKRGLSPVSRAQETGIRGLPPLSSKSVPPSSRMPSFYFLRFDEYWFSALFSRVKTPPREAHSFNICIARDGNATVSFAPLPMDNSSTSSGAAYSVRAIGPSTTIPVIASCGAFPVPCRASRSIPPRGKAGRRFWRCVRGAD